MDRELAVLVASLAAAEDGTGRLVVAEGPAGIGKTTLLEAAAAAGRDRGMVVLRARGSPLEREFPFGIARQAFATAPADPAWPRICRGPAALTGRVLSPGPPDPGPGAEAMHAAAHGLFWLTAHYAAERPVLLCVDDVHWADPPSLRWLAGLARAITGLPLTLVVAVRPDAPSDEALGELLATGLLLRLNPLSAAETRALMKDATPALADACHRATGGNPFLLTALLSENPRDASTVARIGPYQVTRWVEHHLGRLPDGATALARALAVLGPGATLREAATLAGVDPERAAALSDAMRAAGLLGPDAAPVLAHPVVATALHEGMGAGLRGLWHARAARLPARDPERAALHLLRTEPAGEAFVVDLLRAAAGHATARGAPGIAATYLRRALAEPPADPGADTAVRLDLALALSAGREAGPAGLAREVVASIRVPAVRAEAALRCGRALALGGEQQAAADLYRLVLHDPAGVPPADLARIEAEFTANARIDSRTRVVSVEMLERSRAAGVLPELWRVNAMAEATLAGQPASATMLPDLGLLAGETDSLLPSVAAIMLVFTGELDRTRSIADAVIAGGRDRGWPSTVAHGQFLHALADLPAARVDEAVAHAQSAVDFKVRTGTTPPAALLWALFPLVDALLEADRTADAEVAAGLAEPPEHALTTPLFLQSRARLRLALDRPAEALADLLEAGRRCTELGVEHPGVAGWRAEAVRAYLALGRPAEAAAAAGAQLAAARRTGAPGALATALRAAALVAPGARRIALLQQAVRVSTGTPARLVLAYALCDLGATMRRANRRAEAREPLRAALEIGAEGGAKRLAGRALTELHAAGARPRRTARQGMDALTDAEREVVRLARHGLTNRQISDRLTLSRRTVETHLAHAYQKLNIHSRGELTTVPNPGR